MKKNLLFKVKMLLLSWLNPEPEIQEEYVDKVVMLLRRDFTTTEQNKIVVSIARKLSDLRQEDMVKMTKEYDVLQKDTIILKNQILCS